MAVGGGDERTAGATCAVFVSYASQDGAIATTVVETLERSGIACWIAPRDVTPGAFYADEIVHAIDAAKALVLILSRNSADSPHVLREVERAASKRHPVVPLRVDQAPLPAALEYFLNSSLWLNASGADIARSMPKFIAAVRVAIQTATVMPRGSAPSPSVRPTKKTTIIAVSLIGLVIAGFAVDRLPKRTTAAVSVPAAAVSAAASAPTASTIPEKSVAVLPFVDMSEKHDQEYFSDGLSEQLVDRLTNVPELRVPARTSSFYFKGKQTTIADIAKALSVAHVLEGSVRKSGNTLRITAQLIRVDNGYHVWSETYDRPLDDIFKIQDEITGAVVTALRVHMLPTQQPAAQENMRTENLEAYDQYLQGRQSFNQGNTAGYQRAVTAFRAATALDPNYGAAYADLAVAQFFLANATTDIPLYERALAAAEKAVALAPGLAASYAARGFVRAVVRFDFAGAQVDLDKAVALDQNDAGVLHQSATLLAAFGNLPAAIAREENALALDPLSAEICMRLAFFVVANQQMAPARLLYAQALVIAPNSVRANFNLGELKLLENQPEQALAIFRQTELEIFSLAGQAEAEYSLGHLEVSRRILEQLITKHEMSSPYFISRVYAWRGEKDHAFEWLERAYVQRDPGLAWVAMDPRSRNLRGDARFSALLRKMKLLE